MFKRSNRSPHQSLKNHPPTSRINSLTKKNERVMC